MNNTCPDCGSEMELVDTTYSRATKQKTGDIYKCEECEKFWLDTLEFNRLIQWVY